jgi:integrase
MMRVAAKKIDLGKRLYPYVFRHTRITELANIMSERQLKKYFGTSQLDTYEHLITSDLDNVMTKIAAARVAPVVERSINQMVLVR